jgi:hypothetical protein
MIDCSSDRWAGISIDDASILHSVACILHFSAVIITISPGLKCGNATLLVAKLTQANRAWLLLIADTMLTFQNRSTWWRAGVWINLSCRHRAALVQFYFLEGWLDIRDLGAVLEHKEPLSHAQ